MVNDLNPNPSVSAREPPGIFICSRVDGAYPLLSLLRLDARLLSASYENLVTYEGIVLLKELSSLSED